MCRAHTFKSHCVLILPQSLLRLCLETHLRSWTTVSILSVLTLPSGNRANRFHARFRSVGRIVC